MQVAIIEDEAPVRESLARAVREYAAARGCPMQIGAFAGSESFLADPLHQAADILLLDIQMPGMDGMALARRIRQANDRVVLLFVTSMVSYAVQGYQVEALDFLVKPVRQETLFDALDRAVLKVSRGQTHYLNLRTGGTYYHLNVQDLLYVEAGSHKILLHTRQGVIESAGTIRGMEKELEPWGFFCCHAAFLVCLSAITRVEGMDALVNGERIPVSKHRRKALLEKLAAYWGAQL